MIAIQYFGGKGKVCRELAGYINSRLGDGQAYWEPFCGACWVMSNVCGSMRIASDLHPELIAMWRALQTGWEPPAVVTESEYQLIRAGTDMALRGFVGFGCSNSGKWFGGYARNKTGRNYASNARNSLKKKMMGLGDVRFECGGYNEVEVPSGSLIYCDPPYRGTVGYSVGRFDHDRFWEWVRKRSVENTVLVSEYSAPEDFTCVWEIETKTDIKDRTGEKSRRVEQLFEHSSSVE